MAHRQLPSEPTGNTPSLSAILDLVSALEREAPEARETTAYDTPTNPTLYNEVLEIGRYAHTNDHPSPIGRGTEGEGATLGTPQPATTSTHDGDTGDRPRRRRPLPFYPCTALTKRGKPCQFAARRESGLCINHDPAYAEQQRENLLKGARNSARRRKRPPVALRNVDLSRRSSIQALIDTVITLELQGQLSITQSRNIIRLLSIATRNLRNTEHGWTTYGAEPHAGHYRLSRETLAHDITDILDDPRDPEGKVR